jgi:hypothetical protein
MLEDRVPPSDTDIIRGALAAFARGDLDEGLIARYQWFLTEPDARAAAEPEVA